MVSSLSNPPILAKPFAENGDKTSNIPTSATGTQAASLDEGFPPVTSTPINEGGIPPQREDFNGLGYLTTSQFFYLQMGGRFTFNSAVSSAIGGYPQGAVLQYTDPDTGQSYEVTSLIPNNTYNFVTTPSYIDGVKWRKSFSEDLTNYMTYSVLDLLYPVGSIYANTTSTCPLATLIPGSTWTKVATSVVTSIDSTVGIKGTGKTLGLTNGSTNVGLTGDDSHDRNSRVFTTGAYNRTVSSSYSSTNQNSGCFGVVQNTSTSGLTGVANSTSISINIWKRTA